MKAALLVEPKRVETREVPTPLPGKGEVLVRVKEAGICVNAIGPGFFKTQFTEPVWQDHKKFEWTLSRIPLGRVGIPEDAAGAEI